MLDGERSVGTLSQAAAAVVGIFRVVGDGVQKVKKVSKSDGEDSCWPRLFLYLIGCISY
jgi:hypothetical protein